MNKFRGYFVQWRNSTKNDYSNMYSTSWLYMEMIRNRFNQFMDQIGVNFWL